MKFRTFNPATDAAGHRALFRLSFPETVGTPIDSEAHYDWKFRQFPDDVPSYEYVAEIDGRIVGYYAALPYPYMVDGSAVTVAMVCDVMTHPDERGKGIFTKLGAFATGELAKEGLVCTTGYPIRPEVIPGHLKVGWKVVKPLPVYARPIRANGLLPKRLRLMQPLLHFAIIVHRIFFAGLSRSGEMKAHCLNRDAFFADLWWPRVSQFLEKQADRSRITLQKNKAFLQWRLSAPGTDYHFVLVERDGKVHGVAVCRELKLKDIDTLAVLDLDVSADVSGAVSAMQGALAKLALSRRQSLLAAMMDLGSAKKFRLFSHGFLKAPAHFALIVKSLTPRVEEAELDARLDWAPMWLDSDDL